MAIGVKKYNPGFLTDDEIVASFCVRTGEFEALLECLRASTGQSNAHALVIGPRGSGKTHLLLRVATEMRRNGSLAEFYPIVFAEESYEISTIGEFWLECLGRLAGQAPDDERADLRLSYDDLRTTGNDRDLADRCLGSVLDFADRHEKRVVLLVENLNMLFSDMVDPDAGWRLRHTLQTEPRIVLLGSATSRFEEIDHPDHALYDLFRVVTLRPLDTDECGALWRAVSGETTTTRAVRPLQILTGGNPRLLAIIARFGAGQSFEELTDNLLDLVDDHTEYFKSHLETLPALERRVYLALARLWKPSTAREIADLARLDTNKCSALLKRLEGRGAVTVEGGTPRRRQYYLTERLYNIYYLLRRGGGSNQVVKALIDFMVCLYSPAAMWDFAKQISEQVLDARIFPPHTASYVANTMLDEAQRLAELGQVDEALGIYDEGIRRLNAAGESGAESWVAKALADKMLVLSINNRRHEVIAICDDLVGQFETRKEPVLVLYVVMALNYKGMTLIGEGEASKAMSLSDQALAHLDGIATSDNAAAEALSFFVKGWALMDDGQNEKAAAALDEVVLRYELTEQPDLAGLASTALVFKDTILHITISESEAATLLQCVVQKNELDVGTMRALLQFTVRVGAKRALDIIQESPAVALLQPLVTALQQELDQATHVAREVDEVAGDVRRELVQISVDVPEGTFTATVPLEVRNPSGAPAER